MAKKKQVVKKEVDTKDKTSQRLASNQQQADLDEAFIQGKSILLGEFLKEHKVALQPVLEYTAFGIRPNVRLVKYEQE